ncbi:MAG: tetratricopeptide repeat protein [Candidatus Aminicenantes bacterium]|nr:tetratricopeptide repeat protein [Candidatus Aminicenantes bacterium]
MKTVSALLLLFQTLASPGVPVPLESVLAKMRDDNYLGALEEIEVLLESGRRDPRLYYQKGVCETVLGRYADALESLERAREAGFGDTWRIRSRTGIVYFHQGRHQEAREEFQRVLDDRPGDPDALYYRGRIELKQGRFREAGETLLAVLDADPEYDPALFHLGRALLRQGRRDEGRGVLRFHRKREHLKKQLRTLLNLAAPPQASASVHLELAGVYLELGRPSLARDAIKKAEELDSGHAEINLYRGGLAWLRGSYPEAVRRLREYARSHPGDCRLLNFLGRSLKADGRKGEALTELRKAVSRCTVGVGLLADLAELELEAGQYQRAATHAGKIIDLNPLAPVGPFLIAVASLHRRQFHEAESWALKALDLERRLALLPTDREGSVARSEHHRLLHAVYVRLGNTVKAREHEEKMKPLSSPGE